MGAFEWTIGIIALLLLIFVGVAVVYMFVKIYVDKSAKTRKILLMLDPSKSNGHMVLRQLQEDPSGYNQGIVQRICVPAIPDPKDKALNEIKINEDAYYAYDNFSSGDLDYRLPVSISYPIDTTRFSESFKRTTLGQALSLVIMKKRAIANQIKVLKMGLEKGKRFMEEVNTGEFSKQWQTMMTRANEEFLDTVLKNMKGHETPKPLASTKKS